MHLIHIFITSPAIEWQKLPLSLQKNGASHRRHHPDLIHDFYTDEKIREFLKKEFDTEVVKAYETLTPGAYKADLARYCLLYTYGGLYADLSLYFYKPLFKNDGKLYVFRDLPHFTPWDICNGLIGAPKNHRALLRSITLTCENIRKGYYGITPLCPTGPVVFGKAVAETCMAEDLWCGHSKMVLNPFISLRPLYAHGFYQKRQLIALKRRNRWARLSDLNIPGTNDYTTLWRKRQIYAGSNA